MNLLMVFLFTNIYLVNGVRLLQFNKKLIGDHDKNGCIPSAGYSYCNYTKECQRFDEPCNGNFIIKNDDVIVELSKYSNNSNNSDYEL